VFYLFLPCKSNSKAKEATDLFEKNIQACMAPLLLSNDIDSIQAREICSCMLNTTIQLDSTFTSVSSEEEYNAFMGK